ncbi:MAG: amidohydrolase [Nitrososphaerota archaeon]|nr:amidohydrolase family protein [Nitrososphaerota archaeon]MDG6937387.1 amidohydrolase [Nitrososphaerota archaeon]MDG6958746.1 amidohydrolase [Nitrososphaerota archaeon]MDG6961699.1 amidohydrolase [Nitrososphaerota archaeon]MDG6962989.1 amidohydrolase [Nitrososphaerota archaeon]
MSFDVHVHPWTRDFMKKNGPIMKACDFFKLDVDKLPTSVDQILDEMEEAGVTRAVILGQDTSATGNHAFRNYTLRNDEVAAIATKSGGRLIPFAGVDPNAGGGAVKELRRAVTELGMHGLKVHSSANSVYINDRKLMFPIYEYCEEAGIPVLLHTGTTGLGDTEIRYSKPELVDEVCAAFPDLKVIMAHFGWPWPEVTLAIALRNPNVFIDVSGWKPRYIPPSVMPYLNGILQDRFLFGTDYPMLRHREWMDDFQANVRPKLKPGVAEKLLSGNAERFFSG